MADTARVRIGRVRMKAGGADVRVIERQKETRCQERLRRWCAAALESDPPSDAFVAIAWFYEANTPASADTLAVWCSDHAAFPVETLARRAGACLERQMTASVAERSTTLALGYVRDDPDDAS